MGSIPSRAPASIAHANVDAPAFVSAVAQTPGFQEMVKPLDDLRNEFRNPGLARRDESRPEFGDSDKRYETSVSPAHKQPSTFDVAAPLRPSARPISTPAQPWSARRGSPRGRNAVTDKYKVTKTTKNSRSSLVRMRSDAFQQRPEVNQALGGTTGVYANTPPASVSAAEEEAVDLHYDLLSHYSTAKAVAAADAMARSLAGHPYLQHFPEQFDRELQVVALPEAQLATTAEEAPRGPVSRSLYGNQSWDDWWREQHGLQADVEVPWVQEPADALIHEAWHDADVGVALDEADLEDDKILDQRMADYMTNTA